MKPRAASELLSSLLGPGPEHAEERLGWIKVLQLPNVATPLAEPKTTWEKTKHEHPFVTLVRRSPTLRHLHLVYGTELASTSIPVLLALAMRDGSLTGLTGLAVDNTNLPAVLLALKPHAPTLRQLSIFHAGGPQPLLYNQLPSHFELEFPRLRYLANGLLHSPGPTTHWLEDMASDDWTFSCLTKIAVGFPPGDVVRPEIVTQNTFLGDDPASSFFVRGLHSAISSFPHVAISEMREFAFRVCTPDDEEEDDQQSEVELRAKLDEAPDGVAAFVESVVLVDAGGTMLPSATRNLVQLVCRTRFPLLKTVVWITRKKDDLATARPAYVPLALFSAAGRQASADASIVLSRLQAFAQVDRRSHQERSHL